MTLVVGRLPISWWSREHEAAYFPLPFMPIPTPREPKTEPAPILSRSRVVARGLI